MNYRRLYVPGGTYAFTVCLDDRKSRLLVDRVYDFLRAYARVQSNHSFETVAWCVLPNHLHTIWRLPEDDFDFSTRWRLIKHGFTRSVGETSIWQNRFWEHLIRDERDLSEQMDYIHWNPVKHGYVSDPADWPHSSWHRYRHAWGRAAYVGADMDVGVLRFV
jgi:putative transposase